MTHANLVCKVIGFDLTLNRSNLHKLNHAGLWYRLNFSYLNMTMLNLASS